MTDEIIIGVDVGGTFTDIALHRNGELTILKTRTTKNELQEGITKGIQRVLQESSLGKGDVSEVIHGSTIATNAVIEDDLPGTALITTDGFRDALEIGRQTRRNLYDFHPKKKHPLIQRKDRYEAPERTNPDGSIDQELEPGEIQEIYSEIQEKDYIEAVAVSFLFSFANSENEETALEALLEQNPDIHASISSKVHPEINEYERTLATSLNASLKPLISSYLDRLQSDLKQNHDTSSLLIMQSNGGICTAEKARNKPINMLLSGPAAGVQGARYISEKKEIRDAITMDMGGTSCDVSIIEDGEPVTSKETDIAGITVATPMTDIHTIGSGGGTIAWIDKAGGLKIGPGSAGANPGPACYGRGGDKPTITDANVVLGRIDPSILITNPDIEAATNSIERISSELELSVEQAAHGILEIANAKIERAIKTMTVERGRDPRKNALIAYGGAGPVHAAFIADRMDIPTMIVPSQAGAFSAMGLLVTDFIHESGVTRLTDWSDADPGLINQGIEEIKSSLIEEASMDDPHEAEVKTILEMRYSGQSYTLDIETRESVTEDEMKEIQQSFHEAHKERYGSSYPEEDLELVNLRVRLEQRKNEGDALSHTCNGDLEDAIKERRDVWFEDEYIETEILEWSEAPIHTEINGPALLEGGGTTAVVPSGEKAMLDEGGNLEVSFE